MAKEKTIQNNSLQNKPLYKLAVIGGSGNEEIKNTQITNEFWIDTPFGKTSNSIKELSMNSRKILFLERHGKGHVLLPGEIPQKANIWALKSLGVKFIIAISAVGSLREKIKPGELVLPDQIIDNTKNLYSSFFGASLVGHISFADPFCDYLSEIIYKTAKNQKITIHKNKTYVCIEGPAFSTRAESKMYKKWGADVIGMTAIPEAKLAREAGISYSMIAMSTDYDSWKVQRKGVDVEELTGNMKVNVENVNKILPFVISAIDINTSTTAHNANKKSILSDLKLLNQKTRLDLQTIFPDILEG
jgi:5'-methylthioadenosine phosphorylase